MKSPFVLGHVLTSSQLQVGGNFPPSHLELFGVGGVDIDGDDNAVGVSPALNFWWKRHVSEA